MGRIGICYHLLAHSGLVLLFPSSYAPITVICSGSPGPTRSVRPSLPDGVKKCQPATKHALSAYALFPATNQSAIVGMCSSIPVIYKVTLTITRLTFILNRDHTRDNAHYVEGTSTAATISVVVDINSNENVRTRV